MAENDSNVNTSGGVGLDTANETVSGPTTVIETAAVVLNPSGNGAVVSSQVDPSGRCYTVAPDPLDLRDRLYSPTLRRLEPHKNTRPYADPAFTSRVKDQGQTEACTGFALSSLIEALSWDAWRATNEQYENPEPYSPWMLFYQATRYDGSNSTGSTARAAVKGWHKNGASHMSTWPGLVSDPGTLDPKWLADAFHTPLGAYFRVDHSAIPDIHAALSEANYVYVTAQIHDGWLEPDEQGNIVYKPSSTPLGGHAFLLVGYDAEGFWIQNSWGTNWGRSGFARLTYADWMAHAMDAWIAQLGVHISPQATDLARGLNFDRITNGGTNSTNLLPGRKDGRGVAAAALLSTNANLSTQQINAYVINTANHGILNPNGQFATTEGDVQRLVQQYLPDAVAAFGIQRGEPIKIALFAHGGLDDEDRAEQLAKEWIPDLFAAKIFPILFMWETGWLETLQDIMTNLVSGGKAGMQAGGFFDGALDWWDDRFEGLVSAPGTALWNEMKDNAQAASTNPDSGLNLLLSELIASELSPRIELHLIGHSAGAIYHGFLLNQLRTLATGTDPLALTVGGVYFMAAACRQDFFDSQILPHFAANRIRSYTQFELSATAELNDTCTDLYHRSLLYLISNAFEGQRGTPIFGMEKFFSTDDALTPPPVPSWDVIVSPTDSSVTDPAFESRSTSHGGFGDDTYTRAAIITRIS